MTLLTVDVATESIHKPPRKFSRRIDLNLSSSVRRLAAPFSPILSSDMMSEAFSLYISATSLTKPASISLVRIDSPHSRIPSSLTHLLSRPMTCGGHVFLSRHTRYSPTKCVFVPHAGHLSGAEKDRKSVV